MWRQAGCPPYQPAEHSCEAEQGTKNADKQPQTGSLAPLGTRRRRGWSAVYRCGAGCRRCAGLPWCCSASSLLILVQVLPPHKITSNLHTSFPSPAAVLLLSPVSALAEAAPAPGTGSGSSSSSMSISFAPQGFKQAMDDRDEAMSNKCPGGMMDCETLR